MQPKLPTVEEVEAENVALRSKLQYLLDLNKTSVATLRSVSGSLMNQVLENADQIKETVTNKGKDGISLLVENMLKSPVRKQNSRIVATTRGLEETVRQLEGMLASSQIESHKELQDGVQAAAASV